MAIQNPRWRWAILAVVFVLTVVAVIIGSMKPSQNVTLTNLNSVEDLRARFNADKGKVRLVLLLSPT